VSAIEYSGLESPFSAEVCVTPPRDTTWRGTARLFFEAEFASLDQPVLPRRAPADASNLHYVSASDYLRSKQQRPGSASFGINVPKNAAYRLLGRARVRPGARSATATLTLDDKPCGQWTVDKAEWTWTVGAPELALTRGQHILRWSPADSAFELDRICLTDDLGFLPRGFGLADDTPPPAVAGLTATPDGCFAVALAWKPVAGTDVAGYHVYASREADVTPAQAARISSGYGTAFLDWGLRPDTRYTYRVTAVDRAGNESAPTAAASARTAALAVGQAAIEAETAQLTGDIRLQEDPAASGGKAVWVPELGTTGSPTRYVPGKATGNLTIEVQVPVDGTYVLWGRFKSIWREAALSLTIDGKRDTARRWQITFGYHHEKAYAIWGRAATTSYVYCWCLARTNTCPDPRPFQLELKQGTHRLELSGIGEGLSVDQLRLTTDFSWMPEGLRNYY